MLSPTIQPLTRSFLNTFPYFSLQTVAKKSFLKNHLSHTDAHAAYAFLVKAKAKHAQTQIGPPTINKYDSKKRKTCSFIQDGLLSCTFKNTGQVHCIKQSITCALKNVIYMIQCRKCKNTPNAPEEYIFEQTKRAPDCPKYWETNSLVVSSFIFSVFIFSFCRFQCSLPIHTTVYQSNKVD